MDVDRQPRGCPEWGYRLNFVPAGNDVIHHFCGASEIPGGMCPSCHKPLLRLLSLNAKDARLEFDASRHPFVHLLYCWTCSIPYGPFSYKISEKGEIELLQVPPKYEGEFGPEGPYDGFTGEFAFRAVALEPLTSDEQDNQIARCFGGSNAGEDVAHQVGGYPMIHNPAATICPVCSSEMPLLASICDDATGNNPLKVEAKDSFTGNCGVQMVFNFCRKCSVVSAYHSVD